MGSYLSMRRMWGSMASRCGQRQADCRVRSATDATDATFVAFPSCLPMLLLSAAAAVAGSASVEPAKAATCTEWDVEALGWDVSSKYCARVGGGGGATGIGRLILRVEVFKLRGSTQPERLQPAAEDSTALSNPPTASRKVCSAGRLTLIAIRVWQMGRRQINALNFEACDCLIARL